MTPLHFFWIVIYTCPRTSPQTSTTHEYNWGLSCRDFFISTAGKLHQESMRPSMVNKDRLGQRTCMQEEFHPTFDFFSDVLNKVGILLNFCGPSSLKNPKQLTSFSFHSKVLSLKQLNVWIAWTTILELQGQPFLNCKEKPWMKFE